MDNDIDDVSEHSITNKLLTETKKKSRIAFKERRKAKGKEALVLKRRKESKPLNHGSLRIAYDAYIQSKAWGRRISYFYARYGRVCVACGSIEHITVHHMTYAHMGKEPDEDLVALCKPCHNEYHDINGTQSNMVRRTKSFILRKQLAAMDAAL